MKLPAGLYLVLLLGCLAPSCDDEKERERDIEREAHSSAMAEVRSAMVEKDYNRAYQLLSTLRVSEDSPEALEVRQLKADVKSKYIAFHLNLASSLKESGSLNPAHKHVENVLRVDPNNRLAIELRDAIAEERSTGEKVEVQDKSELEKLLEMGRELAAKKKFAEAIEVYNKVIRLDVENCGGYLELGVLYARMGNRKSSAEYYRQFVERCSDHKRAPHIRRVLRDFESYDRRVK